MSASDRIRDAGDRLACVLLTVVAALGFVALAVWVWGMPAFR